MFGVTIPLPVAAALLAGIVAVRVILVNKTISWPNGLISAFFALLGVQSILTSLRFGPALKSVFPIQPVLAMLICPIAYVAFHRLRGSKDGLMTTDLLHVVPAVLMAAIVGLGLRIPVPIDSMIWASFFAYSFLLLFEIKEGPDSFERFGTEATRALVTARVVTLCLLVVILAYDIVIFINLEYLGGAYTNVVVATGSIFLIAISLTVLAFPNAFPSQLATKHPRFLGRAATLDATEEDRKVLEDLEHLMRSKRPFLDPNINITRVARQLNVPARSVSNAVNRLSALNFSQYVNQQRVSEACSLLSETEMPVTEIMFEAGFQTKSTFNREFLAAVGKSPSEYRKDTIQAKS